MEVMIATTVMTVMLISLLSFVQYGTDLWRRGERTIVLSNTARSVADSFARDFSLAYRVASPALNDTLGSITFDIPISSGTLVATGTIRYELEPPPGTTTKTILWRKWIDYSKGTGKIASAVSGGPSNEGQAGGDYIYIGRHQYPIARDVATFTVTRPSSWTAAVRLGLRSLDFGAEDSDGAIYEATTTFLFPGVPNDQ